VDSSKPWGKCLWQLSVCRRIAVYREPVPARVLVLVSARVLVPVSAPVLVPVLVPARALVLARAGHSC